MKGIAAASFHTVIWSTSDIFCCGLNAGQLGLTQTNTEVFVDIPCRSDFKKMDKTKVGDITKVATSDGGIAFATQMGSIFIYHNYKVQRIFSKVEEIKTLACSGGLVNSLPGIQLPSRYKNSEFKIAFLLSSGDLFVWSIQNMIRLLSEQRIWHLNNVSNFSLNTCNVCLVNTHQEAFIGNFDEENSELIPIKNKKLFSFINNEQPNYIKQMKKSKRIPALYRTKSVHCDPLGNNFIALQYDPRHFRKQKIGIVPNSILVDIANNFSQLSEESVECDVVVVIGHRRFPAHAYILAFHSDFLYKELLKCRSERDKKRKGSFMEDREKMIIHLDHVDPDVFEDLLHFMYSDECAALENPRKFLVTSPEKGEEQDRIEAFVVLQEEPEKVEIVEILVRLQSLRESSSKQRLSKKVKYPLKAIKDASCLLKMKKLQRRILHLNAIDSNHYLEENSIEE